MPKKILVGAVVVLGVACAVEQPRDRDTADALPPATATSSAEERHPAVLFLGTSLTAGLGVPEDRAYPALIADTLAALEMPLRVVNAGVNGETSAGGLRRIDRLLREPVSVLVLELGANDGLRGLSVDAMRVNLQTIIDRAKTAHPDVRIVVVGMRAPPNMGLMYTDAFDGVFAELASANGAVLVPFLLEGVGGIAELNQADGIHPTVRGHEILAENVWRVLEEVVGSR